MKYIITLRDFKSTQICQMLNIDRSSVTIILLAKIEVLYQQQKKKRWEEEIHSLVTFLSLIKYFIEYSLKSF